MRLLVKERYRRPFGLSYSLSPTEFILEVITGAEKTAGPNSGIKFTFGNDGPETFLSREELDFNVAIRGLPTVDIGNFKSWYSDCDKVQELIAATNPDAVEI